MLPIYPRVTSVSALPEYRLEVGFADGSRGVVDCSHLILRRDPGVFALLRDPAEFAKLYVHPESRTVTWDNGLDLDPDVLYARAHAIPIPEE
jgi:hypothetical protein